MKANNHTNHNHRHRIKKNILVVDDERDFCDFLTDLLHGRGFATNVAHNGAEGLEVLRERKPSLIILDAMMPKMGGFEFLNKIKSDPKYSLIPVIMLTAKRGPKSLSKGLDLNVDFYLPKPFDFKNLMEYINLILKSK